jgi:hypothetical protein
MTTFVIVGAGPCGLALSTLLSKRGNKITLVEKSSVIGGCHRVLRDDGYFTEHSPRVYSGLFKNFASVLELIGSDFDSLFKEYDVKVGKYFVGPDYSDVAVIVIKLLLHILLFVPYKDVSMKEFSHVFSEKTRSFVDRMCRLTDGTDSSGFSVDKFFALVNHHAFYKLYQPIIPNDVGLFRIWNKSLAKDGVNVLVDCTVNSITDNKTAVLSNGMTINFDVLVFCIPPVALYTELIRLGMHNAFIPDTELQEYAYTNKYITYISISFHWDSVVNVSNVWGFPSSEWGVSFICNYYEGRTIISSTISITDTKGINGLLPDECLSEQLVSEVYSQIQRELEIQEPYTRAILSPTVYRDVTSGKWMDKDESFIDTVGNTYSEGLPCLSKKYDWLYNVGIHSGMSNYPFSSIESAIENVLNLDNEFFGGNTCVKGHYTLFPLLRLVIIIIVITIIWKTDF